MPAAKTFFGVALRAAWLLAAACAAACSACSGAFAPAPRPGRLTVLSWNVQALFDGADSGAEYAEYRASAGWTEAKYRSRLDALGAALLSACPGGPDVVALQEAESEAVVLDLARGPLAGKGYRWTAFASLPASPLGVAALSRHPLSGVRSHAADLPGGGPPRPMLEIRVEHPAGPLVVLVCHWKSKLGGPAETEGLRRASAALASRRARELAAAGTEFLVVGDLNENHDEFLRRGGVEATALLPASGAAAAALEKEALSPGAGCGNAAGWLGLSADRPPDSGILPGPVFYSPWEDSSARGSYAYKGAWETIDHVLAPSGLFDGRGWEWEGFGVVEPGEGKGGPGFPAAYDPRTGRGLSDHLPVMAFLSSTGDPASASSGQ